MNKVGGGTAKFPPEMADQAGSTLEEEHAEVGEFWCDDMYGELPAVSDYSDEVNGDARLWGGAQYRRVKSEIKCVHHAT